LLDVLCFAVLLRPNVCVMPLVCHCYVFQAQDAEIGLALGVAIAICGALLAVFIVAYRYDMHKILAMKVLRSESPGFNPRMHEQGTGIDISNRPDDSGRGMNSNSSVASSGSEWGAAAADGAVEVKKSRKSRSGKTIDF
jgi:hypothetical protein